MSATRIRIFISSVQKEFQQLRRDLKAFLLGDAVLRRFVSDVFLFEDLPAKDRRADQVYLEEVERCDIYLGIFGYEYGREDQYGISPTEHEYDHATRNHRVRLVYVWGSDEKKRAPKMKQLINKASNDLVRRRIDDYNAITTEVYASLVDYLDSIGALRVPPFDTSLCDGATLKHISDWLTDKTMVELALNDRQRQVIKHAKATGRINNAQYRDITGVSERTALRELRQLTQLRVLEKVGHTGRAAHYVTAKHKPVINPPNTSMIHENKTRHKPAKHVTQTDTSTAKSPKSPDRNVDE